MKYDYLVVREQLPTNQKPGVPAAIFENLEAISPGIEVLSISFADLEGGFYAYAACRIPERRKAGSKV